MQLKTCSRNKAVIGSRLRLETDVGNTLVGVSTIIMTTIGMLKVQKEKVCIMQELKGDFSGWK